MQDENINTAINRTADVLNIWLPYKVKYDNIPGLSVAILHNGKAVYESGFGFADIHLQLKTSTLTSYRIASISKVFTSVAILQLSEQNKLNLDDKVSKHLDWFVGKNLENIEIQHLLYHHSGLIKDGSNPDWEDDQFPDIEELKDLVQDAVVPERIGEFKYSNLGYAILGQVVEAASKMSYGEYIKKYITDKLDLKSIGADFQHEEPNLATGYSRFIPSQERVGYQPIETKSYASSVGMISNATDLAKFFSALISDTTDESFLSARSKQKLTDGKDYGLGVEHSEINGHKILGHNGSFIGFRSRCAVDTENNITVAILSNSVDDLPVKIHSSVFEMIYFYLNNNQGDIEKYKHLGGIYRSRWWDKLIMSADNPVAFNADADSPMDEKVDLIPLGEDKFRIDTKDNFDLVGEVAKFTLDEKTNQQKLIWGSIPHFKID